MRCVALLWTAQNLLRQGKVVAEGAWEEHEQLRGGRWATKNLDSPIFIFMVRVRREIAERLKK